MFREPATPDTSQFPEGRNEAPSSGLAFSLKYFKASLKNDNSLTHFLIKINEQLETKLI